MTKGENTMNFLFANAMAEGTAELNQALEGLTKEEALYTGTVLGVGITAIIIFGIIYFILRVIADWKIFTKSGRAGWKSLIPILNDYEEYDLCWKGSIGALVGAVTIGLHIISESVPHPANWLVILMAVAAIACLVLSFKKSMRLSRAFGKGRGFGFGLFLLPPVFRLILGFGKAKYVGKPE